MKVLFAVSNEEISEAIVKRYQKQYKEIISYKNVYYFNAILKEIQKDKSYDRIVISEDLEAFTNTQYNQIDKIIFEKLDSISDEASNLRGDNTPIILICSDRRTKGEEMLIKLFGIGIYDALIGNDRSIDSVCKLIYKSRSKKEAKMYYKVDSDEVKYQAESENDVSEQEIQNILAHFKKLGKNEEKYITSFNNIVQQYNDAQLRVISRVLPLNVRAVLEEKSPKYQEVMSFNNSVSNQIRKNKKDEPAGPSEKLLKNKNRRTVFKGPIIVPSSVNTNEVKKMARNHDIEEKTIFDNVSEEKIDRDLDEMFFGEVESKKETPRRGRPKKVKEEPKVQETVNEEKNEKVQAKRRGRPKKTQESEEKINKKKEIKEEEETIVPGFENLDNQFSEFDNDSVLPGFENVNLANQGFDFDNDDVLLPGFEDNLSNSGDDERPFDFNDDDKNTDYEKDDEQFDFDDLEEDDDNKFNFDDEEDDEFDSNIEDSESDYDDEDEFDFDDSDKNQEQQKNNSDENDGIFGDFEDLDSDEKDYQEDDDFLDDFVESSMAHEDAVSKKSPKNTNSNSFNEEYEYDEYNNQNAYNDEEDDSNYYESEYSNQDFDLSRFMTNDKKIVAFVGTSKNGTSFIVNNLAENASSEGINVAILDTTKNKNSYYIYTKNEENLRNVAENCVANLCNGQAKGIGVNRNLTVYTSLPENNSGIENAGPILETLVRTHDLVLIDCDFKTPFDYFAYAQEIYLVQSIDVLTIQPLTAFLRDLKAKNILDENKIKIILNKYVKVRGISERTIIGGMSKYNDPAMSFMTDLFDMNTVKYITVPFEQDIYTRYLESVINCDVSIKGYSKSFMHVLKELTNWVYPMMPGKNRYQKPQTYNQNAYNGAFSKNMNDTLNQMKRKY